MGYGCAGLSPRMNLEITYLRVLDIAAGYLGSLENRLF